MKKNRSGRVKAKSLLSSGHVSFDSNESSPRSLSSRFDMKDNLKTKEMLMDELKMLRHQLTELGKSLTGLKQTEQILRESEKQCRSFLEALEESEKKYRLIVDNVHEAILIYQHGTLKFINDRAVNFLGYTEEVLTSKPLSDIIHPEDRDFVFEDHIKRLKGEEIPVVYPFRVVTKNGSIKWVEMHAVTVLWEGRPATLNFIRDITARKAMEDKLLALSITDQLTGLYNRRGFLTLAEQQLRVSDRTKKGLVLIFADLDGMKKINDTYGHLEGDKALINAAEVLKEVFRESDVTARIGGDEFAVLAIKTSKAYPNILINRLQHQLDIRNLKKGSLGYFSMSIGLAEYNPDNPGTLDDLMSEADTRMYEQKRKAISNAAHAND